jgi:hypothetical protein
MTRVNRKSPPRQPTKPPKRRKTIKRRDLSSNEKGKRFLLPFFILFFLKLPQTIFRNAVRLCELLRIDQF